MRFEVRDFALRDIFECGQCFRWDETPEGGYIGTCGSRIALMRLEPDESGVLETREGGVLETREGDVLETCESGVLEIRESGRDRGKDSEAFWRRYLDLDRDYGAIKRELGAKDEVIKKAISFGSGIRILRQDPWEATLSFIISQNSNIPRIKKNINALADMLGEEIGEFEGKVYHALPTPEVLAGQSVDSLAPIRLGYRAPYIIETARRIAEDGPEVIENDLESLPGVGPKVANCIRLFGLYRLDSFPIDVWVKKVMRELYGIDSPSDMAKFAEKTFGPYGGIAQQYLFYYMREKSPK